LGVVWEVRVGWVRFAPARCDEVLSSECGVLSGERGGGFVLRRRAKLWRRVARCGFLWRGGFVWRRLDKLGAGGRVVAWIGALWRGLAWE
jgi:hypothetical protein